MEALLFVILMPALAVAAFLGWVIWKALRGAFWLVGKTLQRVFGFVRKQLVQALHTVGAAVTAAAVIPLTLANLLIGRFAAARHYARGIEDEFGNIVSGIYRLAIVNPLHFLGLGGALASVERRLGDLIDHAPRPTPRRERQRTREAFPGYDVIRALPTGGSGARLFLARPRPETLQRLRMAGKEPFDQVVIKSFALDEGSTLPQIVRESRALEAASKLGLVLEHELRPDRFFYVTRYVAGEELSTVANRFHARSGPEGLGQRELGLVLGYSQDLLRTLHGFHAGGLWHKDVKPANVIVADDRAHLVDFGLVTPLASALTLTTHGTEYYRDPEMVRLALQGVRVHEVDGVKFDLYSAGAVLYSLVEGSFPAQGSLSRITKRAPEALKWIVRRSMADIQARYGSAAEMLADLTALAAASDPFALRPVDLPSFRGEVPAEPEPFVMPASFAGARPAPLRAVAEEAVDVPVPRRRRRRRLVAAAAIAIFGMALVAGLFEETRGRHAAELWAAAQHLDHVQTSRSLGLYDSEREAYDEGQAILRIARGDDSPLGELRDGLERLKSALADSVDTGAPRVAAAPRRATPPEVLPWSGERVLLLEDFDAEDEEVAQVLERLLTERGVEVAGCGDSVEEQDLSIIAGARHAIGLGGPHDPDAARRLERFLNDQTDLAGILWVAPSLEGDGHLLRVVSREGIEGAGLYPLDGRVVASTR